MQYPTLAGLSPGQSAYIQQLYTVGEARRRLSDLGFLSGNRVTALFQSPLGKLTAYYIMGSTIALRPADAEQIRISLTPKEAFS